MFRFFSRLNFRRGITAILPVLAALFIASVAYGQESSAAINGTVKDSSGALVEGADITLTNISTGVSRSTVSNSAGTYVFIDVLPAAYSMKVTKTGFGSITQQSVT